jgi:hypothetical protein
MSLKIDDESADIPDAALDSLRAQVRDTTYSVATYSIDDFAWPEMSTNVSTAGATITVESMLAAIEQIRRIPPEPRVVVYLSDWQHIDLLGATYIGPKLRTDSPEPWRVRVGVLKLRGWEARWARDYRAAKRATELAIRVLPQGTLEHMRERMAADACRDRRLLARKERRQRINRRGWA